MKFILNKDNLITEETCLLNAGSIGYYEVIVEHDEQWKDLTIVAVMTKKGETIGKNIAVINNKMYIDEELNGTYLIGFVGYTIENEQKTYQISTNLKTLYFNKGAGEMQTEDKKLPTPSEWEIYLSQIQTICNDIQGLTESLNKQVLEIETKLSNGDFNGKDGENGATFIPNVDDKGNLSWTNDKGLENPPAVNIKGKDGEGSFSVKVSTIIPEVNSEGYSVLEPNTKYYLGEQTELSIAFPEGELGKEISLEFISGNIPTTLNISSENINTSTSSYDITVDTGYSINAVYGLIGVYKNGTAQYGWNLTVKEFIITNRHTPYTELEYIESDGNQLIDTGIDAASFQTGLTSSEKNNFYMDIKFEPTDTDNLGFIFGAYESDDYNYRVFNLGGNFILDNGRCSDRKTGGAIVKNTLYNIRIGNGYIKNLDTDTIIAGSVASSYLSRMSLINNNFYIFADHPDTENHPRTAMRLHSLTIFNGKEFKRDYIPCRMVDGTIGLFDKITGTYGLNAGTGDFIAGPVV